MILNGVKSRLLSVVHCPSIHPSIHPISHSSIHPPVHGRSYTHSRFPHMIHPPPALGIFFPGPVKTSKRAFCILSPICSQLKPAFSRHHTDSLSCVQHFNKQNSCLPICSRWKPKIRPRLLPVIIFHHHALGFYIHTKPSLLPIHSLLSYWVQVPSTAQLLDWSSSYHPTLPLSSPY